MRDGLKYYWILPVLCITLASCIKHSEQTSLSKQNSRSILKLEFQLPKDELKYTGSYHQEGAGPLGPMDIDGDINMIIKPTNKWPVSSNLTLHLTHAKVVDYKGNWQEAEPNELPPPRQLPVFTFDEYGRSNTDYHIGKMPLSMMGDLWPLPNKPIRMGDLYEEKITCRDQQEDGFWKYEGTRTTTFSGYKIINEVRFVVINIHTSLEVQFEENETPVNLTIDSEVYWDISNSFPFKVQQKALWEGTVEVSNSEEVDFTHIMTLNLKRNLDGNNQ